MLLYKNIQTQITPHLETEEMNWPDAMNGAVKFMGLLLYIVPVSFCADRVDNE